MSRPGGQALGTNATICEKRATGRLLNPHDVLGRLWPPAFSIWHSAFSLWGVFGARRVNLPKLAGQLAQDAQVDERVDFSGFDSSCSRSSRCFKGPCGASTQELGVRGPFGRGAVAASFRRVSGDSHGWEGTIHAGIIYLSNPGGSGWGTYAVEKP